MKSRAMNSTPMVTATNTTVKISQLTARTSGLRCAPASRWRVTAAPSALMCTPSANSVGSPAHLGAGLADPAAQDRAGRDVGDAVDQPGAHCGDCQGDRGRQQRRQDDLGHQSVPITPCPPTAAIIAPTMPPISACDELDGIPSSQVSRFQTMPPKRPANTRQTQS
jgi:hypothetical protein